MSQTYLYLDPQFAPTFARLLGFDAFVSGSQRARARVPAARERQVSVACTRCARFPFPVVSNRSSALDSQTGPALLCTHFLLSVDGG